MDRWELINSQFSIFHDILNSQFSIHSVPCSPFTALILNSFRSLFPVPFSLPSFSIPIIPFSLFLRSIKTQIRVNLFYLCHLCAIHSQFSILNCIPHSPFTPQKNKPSTYLWATLLLIPNREYCYAPNQLPAIEVEKEAPVHIRISHPSRLTKNVSPTPKLNVIDVIS